MTEFLAFKFSEGEWRKKKGEEKKGEQRRGNQRETSNCKRAGVCTDEQAACSSFYQ